MTMNSLEIRYKNSKTGVYLGEAWELLKKLLPDKEVIIITDINVGSLYGDYFPEAPVITIGTGETVKELDTVDTIIRHLLAIGADRDSFILGIGGGVVCDIAGFVASIYMRGLSFGFVSTTLLSQVDASIGGKNGVNVTGIKNIIGCFNQPLFVICDTAFLKTLHEDDYVSGLGELVKYALILDRSLFEQIEGKTGEILGREPALMSRLIARSVEIKASVVEKDEKERNERRLLNFGHTLGHAIESTSGLSHGIAVSAGMLVSSWISVDEGLLQKEDARRIEVLLDKLGLLRKTDTEWESISEKIFSDKKRISSTINYILLNEIGKAVQKEYPLDDILTRLHEKTILYEGKN